MPTDISILERPQLATQQLLSGDVGGAWDALLAPQELSPYEQEAYLERLGIRGTYTEQLFKTLTNPLLIVALILSHKFPPAVGEAVTAVSQRVGGLTTKIPFFGKLMSKEAWFRGTPIPGYFDDLAAEVGGFKTRAGEELGTLLEDFRRTTGKLPTNREGILVAAHRDGLDKPLRGWSDAKNVIGAGSTQINLPGVGTLMPDLESKMSPELRQLSEGVKGWFERRYDEALAEPEARKNILRALRKQQKLGDLSDADLTLLDAVQNPKKISNYFAHRGRQTAEDFQRMVQLMTSTDTRRFAKAAAAKAEAWATGETMKRRWAMIPSWQDLAQVEDVIDPAALERLEATVKARVLNGAKIAGVRESQIAKMQDIPYRDLAQNYSKYLSESEAALFGGAMADYAPRQYSLDLVDVMSSYAHTLAGTYGWTVKGYGEKLGAQLKILKGLATESPQAAARADVFENTLLPLAMGRQTFQRALKSQMWQQGVIKTVAAMDTPWLRKTLGENNVAALKEAALNSRGAFSLMGLQQKATGYFYLSTLGLNPSSALNNSLQTVLGLGPLLGWGTTTEAYGNVLGHAHEYFAARFGEKALSHEMAIAKVLPNFAKAGLVAGHMTEEIVDQALRNSAQIGFVPGASKVATVAERVSRAMMSLFTATESVNRLVSFEAGMIHAERAGMHIDAAIPFARDIVHKTQYVLTPTSRPLALANAGPLLRQFVYFPMRMLEFATSSAFTLGSGARDPITGKEMNIANVFGRDIPVLGKYNPGVAARMVASSIIAMEIGDAMGLDVRHGLLESALPMLQAVRTGSPFGAIPVVPPALQVGGSALYGASTGDWDSFKHAMPLLVPGGILTARAAGLVPPQVGGEIGQSIAKTLDRTYADYKQPAPDGRIAVYSGKGTFRGYYTPWDLIKSGLGVRGGDLDKEQQVLITITKNRDSITESKRDYLDARFRNSAREANAVASQFKQKFGFDLPITEQDVQAMQTRRHVTRLEQLIRTAPPGPARESLVAAVQATLGTTAQSMMGVDPALLGGPRPQAEKSRFGTGKVSGSSLPRFDARSDLGPQDQVNPQKIGRQPGVSRVGPPF